MMSSGLERAPYGLGRTLDFSDCFSNRIKYSDGVYSYGSTITFTARHWADARRVTASYRGCTQAALAAGGNFNAIPRMQRQ